MTPPAHTPRGTPASDTVTLSDRLLHTFFVLSATSLTLILALFAFLLTLILKISAIAPTGRSGRRVKFVERSIVIPPTIPQRKPDNSIESSPALVEAPSPTLSLSLTVTPRELEPRTPDVVEDPLQALVRICGFLAANTARAWRHEELAPTPPLAGLELYLAAVQEDLETIDQTGKDDEVEDEDSEEEESEESEGEEEGAAAAEDSEVQVLDQGGEGDSEDLEAGAGEAAGSGSSADAHDGDELGLVLVPDQATHATSPPLPLPPQIPTHPAEPDTSASATTSTPIPAPTPKPTPPSPSPTTQSTSPAEQTDTTPTPTPSTSTTRPPTPQPPTMRKRKDAVLRTTRPSGVVLGQLAAADPDHPNENAAAVVDRLADSDDAAVRAAALFSRVADLGTGIFEGTVRERGAALWAALSRSRGRGTPSEVPVPPLTRTHFATSASERS